MNLSTRFLFPSLVILLSLLFFSLSSLHAQTWEELTPPPFYKHHSNAFSLNGKAYIFEGIRSSDLSDAVWTYDPATDDWTQLADFPGAARAIAIGDEWEGKYYYGFGQTNLEMLYDLWVFDPVDTSFTELEPCPCQGRTHPALIAYKDKIYMGAGSTPFGDLDDWWVYDIPTNTWEQKTTMPGGIRHHPFFFSDGDYVYVGGGHRLSWLKYHIEDETWESIDGEPEGRVAGTQFQYNGYGFVLGGDDRVHDHVPQDQSFMRYNPSTDSWEKLPSTPYGKWAPSSFIIDEYVYYFGGLSSDISGNVPMLRLNLDLLDASSSTADFEKSTLQIFPNPSTSGSFQLVLDTDDSSEWEVTFFDVLGRNSSASFQSLGAGSYASSVKGTFFVVATNQAGKRFRQTLVVE